MTVSTIPRVDIRLIQDTLKNQMGLVEEVHDRGYRDQQLRLDLDVSGGFRELVDELASLRFEHGSLKITGYSAGKVQAKWQTRSVKGGRKK